MIRVLDATSSSAVDIEVDDYLPMKIVWRPRGPVSVQLRISGSEGGELELRIDPETGALVAAVVLIAPPDLDHDPRIGGSDPSARVTPGRPLMDLSRWRDADGQVEELLEPIFITVPDVAWYRDENIIVVRLRDEPVTHRILTGKVAVGVSASQYLATLEVARTDSAAGAAENPIS